VKCIAVARNNFFGLAHFLLEGRIVRCEMVGAVERLDQEEAFAIAGVPATPSELPNLRTLSSTMEARVSVSLQL
jgi:hypothetical protein